MVGGIVDSESHDHIERKKQDLRTRLPAHTILHPFTFQHDAFVGHSDVRHEQSSTSRAVAERHHITGRNHCSCIVGRMPLLLFCCRCEGYLLKYALVSWGALVVRYVFFFGVVSLGYCFAVDSLCDFGTIISALRTICATDYAMLPIFKPC